MAARDDLAERIAARVRGQLRLRLGPNAQGVSAAQHQFREVPKMIHAGPAALPGRTT